MKLSENLRKFTAICVPWYSSVLTSIISTAYICLGRRGRKKRGGKFGAMNFIMKMFSSFQQPHQQQHRFRFSLSRIRNKKFRHYLGIFSPRPAFFEVFRVRTNANKIHECSPSFSSRWLSGFGKVNIHFQFSNFISGSYSRFSPRRVVSDVLSKQIDISMKKYFVKKNKHAISWKKCHTISFI